MLGDNLYDDDYTNEFSVPYKALLDRGVKFYAALGNHDRDLEIHFKPFNMNDVDRYSFDQGNARFAVLNSNHPGRSAAAQVARSGLRRRRAPSGGSPSSTTRSTRPASTPPKAAT